MPRDKIKNTVSFLGPLGATFSNDAYNLFLKENNIPNILDSESKYEESQSNKETLSLVIKNKGYGIVPIETAAEGRINDLVESYIGLLNKYKNNKDCPIQILGAIKMKISFCLMVRKGVTKNQIKGIVAHGKSIGACLQNITKNKFKTIEVESNGGAARLVAEVDKYKKFACLGPQSAADKYNLRVINNSFADKVAATTFFLVGPKTDQLKLGKTNRALIVYKLPHKPGSLFKSLEPFYDKKINLIQIHSVFAGDGQYSFAIEVEFSNSQINDFNTALKSFTKRTKQHLLFGPFDIINV